MSSGWSQGSIITKMWLECSRTENSVLWRHSNICGHFVTFSHSQQWNSRTLVWNSRWTGFPLSPSLTLQGTRLFILCTFSNMGWLMELWSVYESQLSCGMLRFSSMFSFRTCKCFGGVHSPAPSASLWLWRLWDGWVHWAYSQLLTFTFVDCSDTTNLILQFESIQMISTWMLDNDDLRLGNGAGHA